MDVCVCVFVCDTRAWQSGDAGGGSVCMSVCMCVCMLGGCEMITSSSLEHHHRRRPPQMGPPPLDVETLCCSPPHAIPPSVSSADSMPRSVFHRHQFSAFYLQQRRCVGCEYDDASAHTRSVCPSYGQTTCMIVCVCVIGVEDTMMTFGCQWLNLANMVL